MKFKVGDKVKVIDNIGASFELVEVGDIGMVAEIDVTATYPIKVEFEEGFEHLKEEELELIESFESRFKVGDEVRVRTDLVVGKCQAFVSEMEKHKGKVFTVSEVDIDYSGKTAYTLDEVGFLWTDEMLESIDEVKELTFNEVIAHRQPNQTWIGENYIIFIDNDGDIVIESKNGEELGSYLAIQTDLKYTLQEEKHNFQEAFKSYEEGRVIVSSYGYSYKKDDDRDLVNEDGTWIDNDESFTLEEIRGGWYIR